jgi:hypothetical protein
MIIFPLHAHFVVIRIVNRMKIVFLLSFLFRLEMIIKIIKMNFYGMLNFVSMASVYGKIRVIKHLRDEMLLKV